MSVQDCRQANSSDIVLWANMKCDNDKSLGAGGPQPLRYRLARGRCLQSRRWSGSRLDQSAIRDVCWFRVD